MPGDRALLGEADRDRLVAVLREHYAAARIELAEFDRRAGIVLSASYADEAAAALDGLPPLAVPGSPRTARPRSRARHAQVSEPQPGWVPTAERFRDPSSNTIMRVWTDPADGSRHYIPDSGPV